MKKITLVASAILCAVVGLSFVSGLAKLGVKEGNLSPSLRPPELPNPDVYGLIKDSKESLQKQLQKANEPVQEQRLNFSDAYEVCLNDASKKYDTVSDFSTSLPWFVYALIAALPLWITGFFCARNNLKSNNPTKKHWTKKDNTEKSQEIVAFFGTILTAPVWLVFYLIGKTIGLSALGVWKLLTHGVMK